MIIMKRKEVITIFVVMLLMAFILGFTDKQVFSFERFSTYLVFSIIIIGCSVTIKKLVSRYIDVESEIKFWEFQRWGIYSRSHFKKPFPIGIILAPLLFLVFNFRYFFCYLQFDAKATSAKVAKKYSFPRVSGILEWDDAVIAFYGTLVLFILSIISGLFNNSLCLEFSKISIYYALWNILPLGQLDGSRLFFGSRPLFFFTWIIAFITAAIVLI